MLLSLAALATRARTGSAPRTLQSMCKCEHCVVETDNSVADCMALGLDCSCYSSGTGGGDTCADFSDRTEALNAECCDEPTEDCSSGRPAVCNVGCESVPQLNWRPSVHRPRPLGPQAQKAPSTLTVFACFFM